MATIQEIIDFIAENTGKRAGKIKENSRLFHDLAIDGDDAAELLQALVDEYSIDMSEFDFDKYFGSEIGAGWRHLRFRITGKSIPHLQPLTVQDLVRAVNSGKLV